MKKKISQADANFGNKRHENHVKRKDKVYNFDKLTFKLYKEKKNYTKLCRVISRSKHDGFLYNRLFYDELLIEDKIFIPEDFEFKENYEVVLKYFKIIYSSLQSDLDEITISFKYCKRISLASVFLIKSLIKNFEKEQVRVQTGSRGNMTIFPKIKFEQSKQARINQLLNASKFVEEPFGVYDPSMSPVFCLAFHNGRTNRTSYTENAKGRLCKVVIRFLNDSLRRRGVFLPNNSANQVNQMIGEILSNAEDHSSGREWYIMGTLHEDVQKGDGDNVGILDLVIQNFGESIYEGLEDSKDLNHEQYDLMQKIFSKITSVNPEKKLKKFNKSNFFTLFALQEGISRLKYKQESRGTGTVKFINSFMYLGSYVDLKKSYKPELLIVSGDTMIKCDNEFKPFKLDNGVTILTLNKERDLTKLPSDNHLFNLRTPFPGTLLSVRIYLSSKHFEQVLNENGNRGEN